MVDLNLAKWALGVLTASLLPWQAGIAQDQRVDFSKDILPIFEARCFECHRETYRDKRGRLKKPKAGIRLDGKHWILKGGSDGSILVPKDAAKSLLYVAVAGDPDVDDIMPPKGAPLSLAQQTAIKNWIAEGADFGKWVGKSGPRSKPATANKSAPKAGQSSRIQRLLDLAKDLKALPPKTLKAFDKEPALIRPVLKDSPLLRVAFPSHEAELKPGYLKILKPLSSHIAQLDLSRTALSVKDYQLIQSMPRLTRLDLHKSQFGDKNSKALSGLKHLRYLNLYGTPISDAAIGNLSQLKSLEALYLWSSDVSEKGFKQLKQALPKTRIVFDLDLPDPAPEAGESGQNRRRRAKK